MVVDRAAQFEAIREAILECRTTTRQAMLAPTPACHVEDDKALGRVWDLLAELEHSIE